MNEIEQQPNTAEGTTAKVQQEIDAKNPTTRDRWSNRVAFILAAVGSAVGIGNFWRFPYLTYKHGGAVFFIPYLIALFIFGIPMMILELGCGQKFQKGDIGVFGAIHRRIYGIGLCSVYTSLAIVYYYIVIIAWGVYYFFASFINPLPWSNVTEWHTACEGQSAAESYFQIEVIRLQKSDCVMRTETECDSLSWQIFLCSLFCWILTYFAVRKGTKSLSPIVYVTVPLPVILLFIMLGKAKQLPGSQDGIRQYIYGEEGVDKMDKLNTGVIWSEAVGQIFFSLSVCMGIMTSYGSYNHVDTPIVANSLIISITNSMISFISGFVVWSIIGYLRYMNSSVSQKTSSIGLAFIAYPTATVSMGGSNFWCLCLFAVIFLLGIDSAFSMVEAASTVIHDQVEERMSRPKISFILCVTGVIISLFFCLDVGLYLFDSVDHFLNTYVMMLLGIAECIGVGWFYKYEESFEKIGKKSVVIYTAGYWFSLLIGVILAFHAFPKQEYWGFLIWIVLMIISIVISIVTRKEGVSIKSWATEFGFSGVGSIADNILALSFQHNADKKAKTCWEKTWGGFFYIFWGLNIKFIMPTCLTWIMWWGFKTDIDIPYGGYPVWLNVFGQLWVYAGLIMILLPAFWPYKDKKSDMKKPSKIHDTE